jgi:hypothetical protein
LKQKKEAATKFLIVFLLFLIVLTTTSMTIPMASAAGSISLTPSSTSSGSSVNVTGTGFSPNAAIAIAFGAEVAVTGESTEPIGSGLGPHTVTVAHRPIKPGTYVMNVNVNNGLSVYDIVDSSCTGVLTTTATSISSATINYVSGKYTSYTTVDPSSFTIIHTSRYTSYQNNVTPSTGITTSTDGSFSASIIVPAVANGSYVITAISATGNLATSNLSVNTQPVPEGFSTGLVMLLSVVAVLFGSIYLSKIPRNKRLNM